MKICIIVFSPSGHTLAVGREFESRLAAKGHAVQLVNITRSRKQREREGWTEFLRQRIAPHDLLCVGAPVYAGHFESNGRDLISNLPAPGEGWGTLALPFVSYGGIHSSIALLEAGKLLRKKGRINVAGFKIGSFHTLTARAPRPLYPLKPDADDFRVLDEAVKRIETLMGSEVRDQRHSFAYADLKQRIVFRLLSQDFFHRKYRDKRIDPELCTGCGLCASLCPVEIIEMKEGKAMIRDPSLCILCAECFHNCKQNAFGFPYMEKVKERAGKGAKLETPVTRLYPCEK